MLYFAFIIIRNLVRFVNLPSSYQTETAGLLIYESASN